METRELQAADAGPIGHQQYLDLLPMIRRAAEKAFRHLRQDLREEAIVETVAATFVAYCRLLEQGRESEAYSTPLANFAIRRVRSGIRVGTPMNRYEILSHYGQIRSGVRQQQLHGRDLESDWMEMAVEDRRNGSPALVAALRIDFPAWLSTLTTRDRRIAELLAVGELTSDVGAKFNLTPGRISQLRREFEQSWERFHEPAAREEEPMAA